MKTFKIFFLAVVFIGLQSSFVSAQTGSITGKVVDEAKGEALIGAIIIIEGTQIGTSADLEGNFTISNVLPGTYTLSINSVGYSKKDVKNIIVVAGKPTNLNISLGETVEEKKEVVITGHVKKESVSAILIQQKNATYISSGISSESIKQSPDKNTGEVLKRVSGASIQDNKFAIIRGLSDRYNIAMINGALLPSSEPDRRAFSFNLIPSNMLENLIIVKTATPDLPGDFSGGAIFINTKDIPTERFINLSVNTSYNSISTFKPYATSSDFSKETFGLTDKSRYMPTGVPANKADYNKLSVEEKVTLSQKFNTNYAITKDSSAAPITGLQVSMGNKFKVLNNDLGIIFSANYGNSRRTYQQYRYFYEENLKRVISIKDDQYSRNISEGALLNLSYKIGDFNKFTLKNTFNLNNDNVLTLRDAINTRETQQTKGYNYAYTNNLLYLTQFNGLHYIEAAKLRIDYILAAGMVKRDLPDLRNITYTRPTDEPGGYYANITKQPSKEDGGRFFSSLNENTYSANLNFSRELDFAQVKNNFKGGGFFYGKERTFGARNIGYVTDVGTDFTMLAKPIDSLFNKENIKRKGIYIDEITLPNDKYNAKSGLVGGYIMADQKFFDKFRAVYGVRYESMRQELNTQVYKSGKITDFPVIKQFNDLLPSVNLTYSLTDQMNLRGSFSQTVSRPEFRELSKFTFYDFNLSGIIEGNPELKRAQIKNYDFRYEFYPRENELFSVSAFYKNFSNPIELTVSNAGSLGTFIRTFQNIDKATNFGAEVEFRKGLGSIWSVLENVTAFGNFSYIKSEVKTPSYTRTLQGQSPYIINTGIQYFNEKNGLTISAMFNRIGRRISEVGTGDGSKTSDFLDIYENPRSVLDFQIGKVFFKSLEVKIHTADYLGKDYIFYQDVDKSGDFDATKDNEMSRRKVGRNFGFSLNYKF
ncbi:MAG: TonB-dependent receptor [Bacteroidetes bacterium]|nr:TonB-dependent receptor [Bacteroidota bacterium]